MLVKALRDGAVSGSDSAIRGGVRLIETVRAQLGPPLATENPLASISEELRRMAFDGSLRRDIDAAVDEPELAVG